MGVKKAQQMSTELTRTQSRHFVLREALKLDSEADIYCTLPTDGTEDGAGVPAVTPQQWHAVRLLVSGRRGVEVATEVGVSPETLSRWRHNPMFAACLNLALRESYAATVGELRGVAQDAVSVLRESLNSTDERLRFTAAMAILRMSLQLDSSAQFLPTTPADVARIEQEKIHADIVSGMFSFG